MVRLLVLLHLAVCSSSAFAQKTKEAADSETTKSTSVSGAALMGGTASNGMAWTVSGYGGTQIAGTPIQLGLEPHLLVARGGGINDEAYDLGSTGYVQFGTSLRAGVGGPDVRSYATAGYGFAFVIDDDQAYVPFSDLGPVVPFSVGSDVRLTGPLWLTARASYSRSLGNGLLEERGGSGSPNAERYEGYRLEQWTLSGGLVIGR